MQRSGESFIAEKSMSLVIFFLYMLIWALMSAHIPYRFSAPSLSKLLSFLNPV